MTAALLPVLTMLRCSDVPGLQDLSLQHISNILWAYVSFLQMREPMTSAFLEELQLRLRKATFNAQQLSNLLWSLCIAEVAPPFRLTQA